MSNLNISDLPAPRLQLRWAESEENKRGWRWACHYELVMPLGEHDIRREIYDDEGEIVEEVNQFIVAMKEPSIRGGAATPTVAQDGTRFYDDPFRDGSHAMWDAKLLGGLPVYVIGLDGMAFARPER